MISEEHSRAILELCNNGKALIGSVEKGTLPDTEDPALTPLGKNLTLELPLETVQTRLTDLLGPGFSEAILPIISVKNKGGNVCFDYKTLSGLGMHLFPLFAQGILSGGSATSYADHIRNKALSEELYQFYLHRFEALVPAVEGRPKAVVPAYYGHNGEPGPSFLEIKILSWLKTAGEYQKDSGPWKDKKLPPLFLMTSTGTDEAIRTACEQYMRKGPVADLFTREDINPFVPSASVQPMTAALSPVSEGTPFRFYTGNRNTPDGRIPLPGGHGQCFSIWKKHLKDLETAGYRFISIGNIDNIGYTYHPAGTAVLALTGSPAAFEFSRKTEVDIKGGILSLSKSGHLVTREIGSGISAEEIRKGESAGKPVLFNCATGLFDLRELNRNLDHIIANLPVHLSEQVKDAGHYSQAEQNTWDVMGLLDDIKVFIVDKYDRFLAAKMLLETFLTSGMDRESKDFPEAFKTMAGNLSEGLISKTGFLK